MTEAGFLSEKDYYTLRYIMPVKKQYTVERVCQMDFFDNYRVPYNDDASVLVDNTYGVYQITKELNTSHKTGTGRSQKTVYDYPTLNGYLETLRTNLKTYYKSHITDKMFQYELLK